MLRDAQESAAGGADLAGAQGGAGSGRSLLEVAQFEFDICNACRYCEGYCAVFPAMERRSIFTEGDFAYLANLCHDCRACTQACMYAEPHEFDINIPKLLAEARTRSWERKAAPSWLSRAFEMGPLTLLGLNLAVFALILGGAAALGTLLPLFAVRTGPGAFFRVAPHVALMVVPALLLTAYGALVLRAGVVELLRDAGGSARAALSPRLLARALWEAATHRWMRGGGAECYYPDKERASSGRRRFHAAAMYGFLLALLSTMSAFVEEYVFGVQPPYPLLSVPVVLGLAGGVGLILGTGALLLLKRSSSRDQTTAEVTRMDVAFMASLLAVAVTGVLLLALRDTQAMTLLLLIHLSTVYTFYLTAPYGKFVHGVYRFAALILSVQEREAERTS